MKIIITIMALLAFALTNQTFAQVDYKAAAKRLANSGELALKVDDNIRALKLFEQSMVANPKHLGAYIGLAKTHFSLGNDDEGFKYYNTALMIDPVFLPALEGKALEYLKRDSLDEANVVFAAIQKICEALICEEVINVSEAIASYEVKIKIN